MRWHVLAAACLWGLPVVAEPAIRAPDAARLDGFEDALGLSLRNALAMGAPADVQALVAAMAGEAGDFAAEGAWTCRTIRMGHAPALVVYAPFRCQIARDTGGWRLVKETGSQRMAGRILRDDDQWIYLGVGHVAGGPATDYAGLPPVDQTPVEPGQTVAQVGIWEQTAPGRARLMLPSPVLEGTFDILELTR